MAKQPRRSPTARERVTFTERAPAPDPDAAPDDQNEQRSDDDDR